MVAHRPLGFSTALEADPGSVVNSSQESSVMPEDDNGSDTSQFAGSTINLQDLE